jgi:hypothetical protein
MTDDQRLVRDLLRESAAYTARALSTLPPHLADRLALAAHVVAVTLTPASVRLIAQGDGGALRCVHLVRGDDLPTDLCATTALIIESVMNQLKPKARANLARHLQHGAARLSLIVDLMNGAADVQVDDGGTEPAVLARLRLQQPVAH